MLALVVFFPAIAAILGFVVGEKSIKTYGVSIAFIEFLLTVALYFGADFSQGYDMLLSYPIIARLGVGFVVGVDGISVFLVIMSAFMSFIALFSLSVRENLKHLIIAILFLQTTMMGVFLCLDVVMFYVFWELSLLPMLYIIGAWGSGDRIYASVKFFIYTFAGSVFLLVGIIYMGYANFIASGEWSFSLIDWSENLRLGKDVQMWLFAAFSLSFAIKTPCFPFHTWLPYAHGQAPTVGSVLLAAVLLKMGTYGFVRFSLPLFPDASVALFALVASLAGIAVVYTAFVAYAQDDMKQVIAYSSVSHMGIIVLGIFSFSLQGIMGAMFLMISHAIVSGALFMMIGMLYDRTHTKQIAHYGGLARRMPFMAFCFGVTTFASIGLPLTIGFVGEFLSLIAIFRANAFFGVVAGLGIIVGAVYMLSLYRRIFFGRLNQTCENIKDLSVSEAFSLVPLVLLIIVLGVMPNLMLKPMQLGSEQILQKMVQSSQIYGKTGGKGE